RSMTFSYKRGCPLESSAPTIRTHLPPASNVESDKDGSAARESTRTLIAGPESWVTTCPAISGSDSSLAQSRGAYGRSGTVSGQQVITYAGRSRLAYGVASETQAACFSVAGRLATAVSGAAPATAAPRLAKIAAQRMVTLR